MKEIADLIIQRGLTYAFKKGFNKIINKKVPLFDLISDSITDKEGIEIGGPSKIFHPKGFIPVYPIIKSLDGCNFSNTTLWEGNITSGEYSFFEEKEGVQYISEATDLNLIENSKYDFVLSSHCLEHIANPIKAVKEWLRVIKNEGYLLLVLPNKKYSFDHKRPHTNFSHMLEDYEGNMKEDDLTHLNEILKYHDLKRDKPAGTLEQFKERSLKNFENRALHQHVFSIASLKEIYHYCDLKVLITYEEDENLIIFGQKLSQN